MNTKRKVILGVVAVWIVAAIVLSLVGSHHGRQRLSATDLPDVLGPGIWPGTGVHADKTGDTITIYTNFATSGPTNFGRSVGDAAAGMCSAALGDYGYGGSEVKVLAGNGQTLDSCP